MLHTYRIVNLRVTYISRALFYIVIVEGIIFFQCKSVKFVFELTILLWAGLLSLP